MTARPTTVFVLALIAACAVRRSASAFRVVPEQPDYVLRSPDSKEIPFPEVLSRYTNTGSGWVELRPLIELRVENAYFREGAPKHGLANFLGTEIARFRVNPTGELREISVESRVDQRPLDQPSVRLLLSEPQKDYQCHRLFYQVLVSKKSNVRSAVLLGSDSTQELNELTTQLLTEPDSVCGEGLTHCTVFPEACTASLEIEIVVNGTRRKAMWGGTLADFADEHTGIKLFRSYQGRLTPVEVDVRDHEALHVPLLPGDVIRW